MSDHTGTAVPDFVPTQNSAVVTAIFDGEGVLYHAGTATPTWLNTTATAVWSAIDGERSVGEITSALAARFGADESIVGRDVAEIVNEFVALGLLIRLDFLKS